MFSLAAPETRGKTHAHRPSARSACRWYRPHNRYPDKVLLAEKGGRRRFAGLRAAARSLAYPRGFENCRNSNGSHASPMV